MSTAFLYGNGGGIDNLKFRVYSATSLPASGKENDVCIITSTLISTWEVCDGDNPAWDAPAGYVYLTSAISNWTESPNLLRKNLLYLKLIRCWQYENGTWSTKNAYQYRNDAWVQFSSEFTATINVTYPSGSTCTASDGVTTLTAPDTSGTWSCVVPKAGTWTVTATDGTNTKSEAVSITTDGQVENTSISYKTYIIQDGAFDENVYTYAFSDTYWDSSEGSFVTQTGEYSSSYIKENQTYNDKNALWLTGSNGSTVKHSFANITVPTNATTFIIDYGVLAAYENPVLSIGSAKVTIDSGSAWTVKNGTATIDVSGIVGTTVTFIYQCVGASEATDSYIYSAWFE